MLGLVFICTVVSATIGAGVWLRKSGTAFVGARGAVLGVMSFLFVSLAVSLVPAFAAEVASEAGEISSAASIGLIGAALAAGLACIGAGVAVGYVGAAALGIVGEKPQMLGTTLIYLGLAEGIAIYGIIIALLIMGRL
jgi:V/A-type H+-transporting ATPase subunit K